MNSLQSVARLWGGEATDLKVEATHGERFTAREQARAHVFEYIEVDYNRDDSILRWATSAQRSSNWPASLNRVPEIRGRDQMERGGGLRNGAVCETGRSYV